MRSHPSPLLLRLLLLNVFGAASFAEEADAWSRRTLNGSYLCAQHGSCGSCTKDGCLWCPVDERCHRSFFPGDPCNSSDLVVTASRCPPVAPRWTHFNQQLARHLTVYADAAYFDAPQLHGLPDTAQVVARFNYTLGIWEEAFGYLAYDPSQTQIVLAFRGTTSFTELFEELLHHALVPLPGHGTALVNEFFLQAVEALIPQVKPVLQKLQKDCQHCQLFVTGHSLGGSMALLTALNISSWTSTEPIVYTFGQPRLGNAALAEIVNSRVPETYRLVNAADPVPHMPACELDADAPMIRQGSCAATSTGFYHAGHEIWFPAGQYRNGVMCGFRECVGLPRGEDWSCSDSVLSSIFPGHILDHHGYWRVISHGFCGSESASSVPLIV